MKTQSLSLSDESVTRIFYDCMQLGNSWDDSPLIESIRQEALRIIHTALNRRINHYDHADISCRGKSDDASPPG